MRPDPIALLLVVLALGCAHVETRALRLGPTAPPLSANAAVIVRAPPLGSVPGVREIGLIEVTSHAGDRAQVVRALQESARQLGADLVLWMREDFIDGFGRVIASALRTPSAR